MTVFDNDDYTLLNPGTVFTDLIQNVVVEYNKEHGGTFPPSAIAGQFSAINQSCFSEMLDNQKLLENYVSIVDKYQIMCEEQSFHDGFCLGMKIAAEAFMGSEEILE